MRLKAQSLMIWQPKSKSLPVQLNSLKSPTVRQGTSVGFLSCAINQCPATPRDLNPPRKIGVTVGSPLPSIE